MDGVGRYKKTRQLLGAFSDVAPVMPYGGRADSYPSGGNFQADQFGVLFGLGLAFGGCKHLAAFREEIFSGGITANSPHFLRELGEFDGVRMRHNFEVVRLSEGVDCAIQFYSCRFEFLLFLACLFYDASFSSREKQAASVAGKGCRSLITRPRLAFRGFWQVVEFLPDLIEVTGFLHRRIIFFHKKRAGFLACPF